MMSFALTLPRPGAAHLPAIILGVELHLVPPGHAGTLYSTVQYSIVQCYKCYMLTCRSLAGASPLTTLTGSRRC